MKPSQQKLDAAFCVVLEKKLFAASSLQQHFAELSLQGPTGRCKNRTQLCLESAAHTAAIGSL